MLSQGPNPAEILLVDLDQSLRESALLETIEFLDQLLRLSPLPPAAHFLASRSLRRLIYFYRHFHAGEALPSPELRLLERHHPALAARLRLVPSQAHSQVRRDKDLAE